MFPDSRWDPWYRIYFGASLGCVSCFEASLRYLEDLPPALQGDAWAITARGWWALGRPNDASDAWETAQCLGGREVEALRPFLVRDGRILAEQRARAIPGRGAGADAWCDVAALAVLDKDLPAGREAIERALTVCPDHAEAKHWMRALNTRDFVRGLERVRRGRAFGRRAGIAEHEAERIMPLQGNGWLSPERHSRRIMVTHEAPSGSAMERLVAAGAHQWFLRPEEEWAALPAVHPDVEVELALDQIVALHQEGRDPLPAATEAWAAAEPKDRTHVENVGHLLCQVAFGDPAMFALGREVADGLVSTAGDAPAKAWRAWFGARLGDADAVARAREVLAGPVEERLTWRLAVSALYHAGAEALGAAEIGARLKDPARSDWAREVTGKRAKPAEVWLMIHPWHGRARTGADDERPF